MNLQLVVCLVLVIVLMNNLWSVFSIAVASSFFYLVNVHTWKGMSM